MQNEQLGVHVLYKKLGETPLETIERFKKDNIEYADIPMTYAGRLDPMAEGVLLVLSGEGISEKQKYLDLQKTYTFQILWGVATDTLDLLGRVVESYKVHKVESEDVQKELENSIGKFEQKYPTYSSKPVNGVPLFQLAREGKLGEIEIPKHEVELVSAKFISRNTITSSDLQRYIVTNVSLVTGDFRQEEIIEKWQRVISKGTFDIFTIDTIEVVVGSGFYVRQFVSDLAEKLGTVATTFHIKRDKVGDLQPSSKGI